MEFRRRVPRLMAGWIGYCHFDGDSVEQLRECRILDISEFGVGISLQLPHGTHLVGRHVSVETPTFGASVNVRLEGTVRNVVHHDTGPVRLGIEFVGLTEVELSLVRALGVLSEVP
jgi:PilZ domain